MSEIAISRCFVDPWYAESIAGDLCAPGTTKEDDAYKGKWVRIPRNLNMQSGLMSLVRLPPTGNDTAAVVAEYVATSPHVPSPPVSAHWFARVRLSITVSSEILHRVCFWGPCIC